MVDDHQCAADKEKTEQASHDNQADARSKQGLTDENAHMQAVRQRINELAAKAKSDAGLTEAETKERAELRQEFLANFKKAFQSQVEMMQVFDKEGNEVTPDKVRKIQREKGLRDD